MSHQNIQASKRVNNNLIFADAVFFGHTHTPYDDILDIGEKRIHLFNPGSIGYGGTYGVVNTSGRVLVTSHTKIQ